MGYWTLSISLRKLNSVYQDLYFGSLRPYRVLKTYKVSYDKILIY